MRADRILRIALWETTSNLGVPDRRTGAVLLLVLVLLGALGPALIVSSPAPGADLYRVGVSETNPYFDVVQSEPSLQAVDPQRATLESGLDIRIVGSEVYTTDTEKSAGAAGVFRDAVLRYNTQLMAQESDRAASFPVTVTLRYAPQSDLQIGGPEDTEPNSETPQEPTEDGVSTATPTGGSGETAGTTTAATSTAGDGGTEKTGTEDPSTTGESLGETEVTETEPGGSDSDDDEPDVAQDVFSSGPIDGFFGSAQAGTPTSIAPPFPLESLLLAFVFLLPFNFVIQAYGSTVIAERVNRRGEPLLVSPATRGDIILGKALPYFLGSIAITAVIALLLGGGIRSVLAIAPLAALFIASTFLAGLLSRSYKELTFATVTISVFLTAFAFLPAVFAEIHPIAAISPLTIVVKDLQGTAVGWQTFLFATLPVTLSALVLFILGTGLYREEDLFTQRSIPQKALDGLAGPLDSPWLVGVFTALFIPFVLVAELLAVAMLYLLPVGLSVPILLGIIAIIEEVAKSIHVYAGFQRARFEPGLRNGMLLGGISGFGFFLAEKLLVITQLVGLPDLTVGQAAFGPEVLGITPALLLLGPLVLHTGTAAISALGAQRSKRWYLVGLGVATVIHFAYNFAVVSSLG